MSTIAPNASAWASFFGAIAATGNAVTQAANSVTTTLGMAEAAASHASMQQQARQAVELERFTVNLVKEAAVEDGRMDQDIAELKKDEVFATAYDAAHSKYTAAIQARLNKS